MDKLPEEQKQALRTAMARNVQFHSQIQQQQFKVVQCGDRRHILPRPAFYDAWKNKRLVQPANTSLGQIQKGRIYLTGYLLNSGPSSATNFTNPATVVPQHGNHHRQPASSVLPRYRECMKYAHLGCRHFVPSSEVGPCTMATGAVCNNLPRIGVKLQPGRSIVRHFQDPARSSHRVIIKKQDTRQKMVSLDLGMAENEKHEDDDEFYAAQNLEVLAQAAAQVSGLEESDKDHNDGTVKRCSDEGVAPARASQRIRKRQFDDEFEYNYQAAVDGQIKAAPKKKQAETKRLKKSGRKRSYLSGVAKRSEEISGQVGKQIEEQASRIMDERQEQLPVYGIVGDKQEARPVHGIEGDKQEEEGDIQEEKRVTQDVMLVKGIEENKQAVRRMKLTAEKPVIWIEEGEYEEATGAVVRTKRGRNQNLPARFQGSVLGTWKKGGKKNGI